MTCRRVTSLAAGVRIGRGSARARARVRVRGAVLAVALLVAVAVPRAVIALVIDTCTTAQQLSLWGPPPGPDVTSGGVSGPSSGLLGGSREVRLERTSGNAGPVELDVGTAIADTCTYASGSFTTGTAVLSYDGPDGSALVTPDGLGGIDLTAGGTQTGIRLFATSDRGAVVTVTLHSGVGACGQASVSVPADPTFTIGAYDLLFAGFTTAAGCANPANPASVGAITVHIDGATPAVDLAIDLIETFAAPPPTPTVPATSTPGVPAPTPTGTPSATAPSTGTPTVTPTATASAAPTDTPTSMPTLTPTATAPPTPTASLTPTSTPSGSPTATQTPTVSATATPTSQPTETTRPTETPRPTETGRPTETPRPATPTATPEEVSDESEDPDSPSPCNDRVDNDRDGLTDCADPQCAGDRECPTAAPTASWPGIGLLVAALAAVAARRLR